MLRRGLRKIDREVVTIAVMALLLFSARFSLADHYVVPTSSMEYTLMPGDRVVVDKTVYGIRLPFLGWEIVDLREPRRGEVVVFDSPEGGKRLIKRVVAVSGDVVRVDDGHLWINGERTALPDDPDVERLGEHLALLNLSLGGGPELDPLQVGPGRLLVMGDFRGNSRDGRMFGLVDEEEIYGRAVAVFHRRGEGFTWWRL